MGERLVARGVKKVSEARHRLGEAGVLVLHEELRHLLAVLPAHVRKDRQHLEREAPLDVGKVDDGVLEVVEHKHEEKARYQRKRKACAEYDHRVGQHGRRGYVRRPSHADNLVVALRVKARLVLVHDETLENAVRDLEVGLEHPEAGFRQHYPLLAGGKLVPEVKLLVLEADELVAHHLQRRAPRHERALHRVEKALPCDAELLLPCGDKRVVLRAGDEQLGVLGGCVLECAELLRDVLRAGDAGRESAEALGILLHVVEELLPFYELRLLGLEREYVARRL